MDTNTRKIKMKKNELKYSETLGDFVTDWDRLEVFVQTEIFGP